MGSVGDADDNAMAERFFATLECELLYRRQLRSHTQAHTSRGSPTHAGGTPPSVNSAP